MNLYQLADAMFRRGYMRELRKQLPVLLPDVDKSIYVQLEQDADGLFEANKVMAIDASATSNLKTTSLALATYRLLRARGIERNAALSFLRSTLIESNRKKMKSFMLVLRLSRNPLALMTSISESKAKSAYGEAFEFEHETDDKQTYFTTKVKKCLFHDFSGQTAHRK